MRKGEGRTMSTRASGVYDSPLLLSRCSIFLGLFVLVITSSRRVTSLIRRKILKVPEIFSEYDAIR